MKAPQTLWDLVRPRRRPRAPLVQRHMQPQTLVRSPRPSVERYERMTREMLARYGVRVRKWRSSTSGCAWEVYYADGRVSRLIESPRPRGPVSAAIFLHEIGHHAIGLGRFKPRCLEEFHAWDFALTQMEAWDIQITDRVRARMDEALRYAVAKARRRGLRQLPTELAPYADGPRDGGEASDSSG